MKYIRERTKEKAHTQTHSHGQIYIYIYIYISDLVKTWPLGGLTVQLDSPGTALTVRAWIRPWGQN